MFNNNKIKYIVSIFVTITLLLNAISSPIVLANSAEEEVLIIYDSRFYFGFHDDLVVSLKELINNFKPIVKIVSSREDISNIEKYKYVFIIGINGDYADVAWLNKLNPDQQVIIWLGKGVEYYLNKYLTNIKYVGQMADIIEINYQREKEFKYVLEEKREFTIIKPLTSDNLQIFASLTDGINTYPFAIKQGNFWYLARIETNSIVFYIFADLLNDIFLNKQFSNNTVYVRIEDVNPTSNPEKLMEVANMLKKEKIPYMIALIPVFFQANNKSVIYLKDNPELVKVLQYMQENGGSIVLHGYYHSSLGNDNTGEGFEFWDYLNKRPLADIEKLIQTRVASGVNDLLKLNLYPLAFEAPHYAISLQGYKELKKYFSTYVGQMQTNDYYLTSTSFPYILSNTDHFNKFLPENLGYLMQDDLFSLTKIKETWNELSMVRGYMAGVFYHPTVDIAKLNELIDFFLREDVTFYDLKKDKNWVKVNNIYIQSNNGSITVTNFVDKDLYEKKIVNLFSANIINFFLIFFSFTTIFFLVLYLLNKLRNDSNLLR